MATPTMVPAGWYTDPARRHEYRYWDGTDWTSLVADNGVTATDPLSTSPPFLSSAPESESPSVARSPSQQGPGGPSTVIVPPPAPAAVVARRGRRRWAIPLIAAAGVLALIVGLVIWAPWRSPPLLRPTGLTADPSTTGSVVFHWSRPATGPAPDRYVILADGKVIGSVRGTVTSYRILGLAPATAYQYRVAAVRGGKRSAPSAVLAVSTLTPPVSAARLQGSWTTSYKVIRSGGGTFKVGKTWTDTWSFSPACATGPCAVVLSGPITGPGNYTPTPFTVHLARAGAVYTGTTIAHITNCGVPSSSVAVRNTLTFRISVTRAATVNRAWEASSWAGTMVMSSPYTSAGAYYCPAQSVKTVLSGGA